MKDPESRILRKVRSGTLAALVGLFAAGAYEGEANAALPNTLTQIGFLTDNAGAPVTASLQIQYSIYDVASGGTALWTETQTVNVEGGYFSTQLGAVTPLTASIVESRAVARRVQ